MRNIALTLGNPGDLDAVETVENGCFTGVRRSSRRALLFGLRSPTQQMWIAWGRAAGGMRQVAGVLTLHIRRRSVRIYSLAVMPAFRGIGLGRRLVDHAISEAKRRGALYVSLEAERKDRRLVRWYARFGFETVRILPDYYAVGQDAVRMTRAVTRTRSKEGGKTA